MQVGKGTTQAPGQSNASNAAIRPPRCPRHALIVQNAADKLIHFGLLKGWASVFLL